MLEGVVAVGVAAMSSFACRAYQGGRRLRCFEEGSCRKDDLGHKAKYEVLQYSARADASVCGPCRGGDFRA